MSRQCLLYPFQNVSSQVEKLVIKPLYLSGDDYAPQRHQGWNATGVQNLAPALTSQGKSQSNEKVDWGMRLPKSQREATSVAGGILHGQHSKYAVRH